VKKTPFRKEESSRDSFGQSVQRTPEEQLAVAIRELRQSLSLTQVQLAAALGITPTSVYRYEAGSSFPDVNTLARFWQFAVNKKSPAAIPFTAILAAAIPALQPVLEPPFQVDSAKLGSSREPKLTPEEELLVMAFVKMLQSSPIDPLAKIARRVSETLLEPWYEQSKKELSEQIHEHFGQAFKGPKEAAEEARKHTGKKLK
jgi:transcriptional regulator with XRE-family HTH domain